MKNKKYDSRQQFLPFADFDISHFVSRKFLSVKISGCIVYGTQNKQEAREVYTRFSTYKSHIGKLTANISIHGKRYRISTEYYVRNNK